jgi:hypothetical protein
MSRLWKMLTARFPDSLAVLPGGRWLVATFYVACGVWMNYVFIYAVSTGKMRGRFSGGWIAGRESAPFLYWLYVCGYGGAVIFIDGFFVYWLSQRNRDRR